MILMDFYWRMIKLKYNFKQWHIFTISEFFKNVNNHTDRVKDVYYNILESNMNENGRSKMLQNIAIDNIINLMDLENICSMKETFSYSKQDENTIMHIADVIIKYEQKFFNDVMNYYADLCSILKKLLSTSYSMNVEKNKIILYLTEVCLKWMNRIIDTHSLPDSSTFERRIEVDYERPFMALYEVVSISMQKILKVLCSNLDTCLPESLLKFIILYRDVHKINPAFSVEHQLKVEANLTDKDGKEKRLFVLNCQNIGFNSFMSPEAAEKVKITSKDRHRRFTELMSLIMKSVSHPCVYSMIADIVPKFASWARQNEDDKKIFCQMIEKWVIDNIVHVNRVIEEKASELGETVLHLCLPHLAARILHSLCDDHADLLDKELIVKVQWVYKKLQLFLENYFKKVQAQPGIPPVKDIEYKPKHKNIFFPIDYEIKYETSDLHYSQVTICYSMKLAAVKAHEFDINALDDFLKLLDSVITYCKNEDLAMMIYEVYECLLQSPQKNVLNVQIDLSPNKKGWLACCLLKKAVADNSKRLKDKMENVISEMLQNHMFNNVDEMMNCYEYAMFFFTKPENKRKIQRAFEASFGGSLFTKLRIIFEKMETQEFTKMNLPPIIMRKIFDAIMSHFDDRLIMCQSNKCLMLRDLSNSNGTEFNNDEEMKGEEDAEIDKILVSHKKFLDNPKMRDEKQIFDLLKLITNVHDTKYYYHNVKKLLPQVWKTFTKEQKNYLSQCITSFFKHYIKFLGDQRRKMTPEFENFPNELLEIFQKLEPQICIEPELYARIANKYNCWVNCILMIEQQLKVVPDNDKYTLILNDLYNTLEQDDYQVLKNNTKTVDKAQSFAQFRMWEEVSEELNNALGELYQQKEVNIDLKYANEYDQKIWEDLHSESILQIGDQDRQKFFQQNNRSYGTFKAEFQKWLVLGRNSQTYQVFENNREKLCQEWTSLPRFIDQVHYNKLTKFQENVELNEIMALLNNTRSQQMDKIQKDF